MNKKNLGSLSFCVPCMQTRSQSAKSVTVTAPSCACVNKSVRGGVALGIVLHALFVPQPVIQEPLIFALVLAAFVVLIGLEVEDYLAHHA